MGIFNFTSKQKRFSERDSKKAVAGKSYSNFLDSLENEQQDRVRRIKLFWDFYEGAQWAGNAPDSDLFVYGEQRPTVNYCKRLVDTRGQFLMKNGFKISIPEIADDSGNTTQERQFIKDLLDRQWELNGRDIWAQNCVQTGGVTGDVFVRVSWDEGNFMKPGYAKAEIMPSNWVFPQYHSIEKDKLQLVIIAFPFEDKEYTLPSLFQQEVRERDVTRLYQEFWTEDQVIIAIDGEITEQRENKLGVIPIVHIKNMPNANGHFGESDLSPVVNVQRLLNEKVADISDVIEYHGSPQTYIIGANASELVRGPDKVWSIPNTDAKIGNLELQGELKPSLDFIAQLRQYMLDLSAIPEQAINPTKNVSNTPGVALHMSYLPMIETRKIQSALYGKGIKDICTLMLQFNAIKDSDFGAQFNAIKGYSKYRVNVGFGEALPRDESLRLTNDQQRLDMGIASRKQILVELGFGETDAERIIEEADEDAAGRAEMLSVAENVEDAAFGKARKPDPVVQGDKVSAGAGK